MLSKEFIKRILREDNNTMRMILRRVNSMVLDQELQDGLETAERICRNKEQFCDLDSFKDIVISVLIDGIHWHLYSTIPEEVKWYKEVSDTLKNHFSDRIDEKYYSLAYKLSNSFKRRIESINNLIELSMYDTSPCDFNTADDYVKGVANEVLWELRDDYHGDISNMNKDEVNLYILNHKRNHIIKFYKTIKEQC